MQTIDWTGVERWMTSARSVQASTLSNWGTAVATWAKFLLATAKEKPLPGTEHYLPWCEYVKVMEAIKELAGKYLKIMGPKKTAEALTNKRISQALNTQERKEHQQSVKKMIDSLYFKELLLTASKVS